MEIFLDVHKDLPRQDSGRDKYTQKAFEIIPKINQPRILDIGCGPGIQTIKLAKLSDGEVIGIDIFQQYLDQLDGLIKKENLQNKVKAINQSMHNIKFPEEYFDIIWAEGSIFIIGFETGLKDWKKYIRPNGYLAVHEMAWHKENPPKEIKEYWQRVYPKISSIDNMIKIIQKCGYKILGHFTLPKDAWWYLYYTPLENRLEDLRIKYKNNTKAI